MLAQPITALRANLGFVAQRIPHDPIESRKSEVRCQWAGPADRTLSDGEVPLRWWKQRKCMVETVVSPSKLKRQLENGVC